MRNMGQYEAVMSRGRYLSPHVGCVAPAYPALADGPTGDKLLSPTKREHWPHVLSGLGMPSQWVPCDEASGNLVDRGLAGLSYVVTGSVTYQQTITGSSLSWVTIPQVAGNGARIDTINVGPDPGMPIFAVFDFRATATGGDRTLFTIAPNAIVQLKSTGVLQLTVTGSTAVTGTVDLRHATNRHRIAIYWDPGDTARGGPILRVWTRHETIAITSGSGPGGIIAAAGAGTFGIGGTLTCPALTVRGLAIWDGLGARRVANLGGTRQGGRTLLIASGATVLY